MPDAGISNVHGHQLKRDESNQHEIPFEAPIGGVVLGGDNKLACSATLPRDEYGSYDERDKGVAVLTRSILQVMIDFASLRRCA
jgi:hypothetical protein